ncbi:MAG: ATP-binding cassette domain-containing protein [Crocinitomicaceae bacterium]|nr:ATP-binding cassette domain-containing protein [Crocinitomicaceae bacterium]
MLSVENISKSFLRKQALDDVSFKVEKGSVFGLLGPNGAGKTTLIRIINQIIEPDAGIIRINNDIVTRKHLATIGYMPEERGLYKTMTVEEHALFLGRLRGLSKQDASKMVNYWLDKFEISNWKKKRIEELSKGMAQKVQFICTVLHEPELLILDEPYSGFDPINMELVKNELIAMRNKGKTIVLSTHNMKSVEEVCDSVALIHNSKKLLDGNVATIQGEKKAGIYAIKFRGNMIAFVNALWTGYDVIETENPSDNLFVVKVKMRNDSNFESLLRVLLGQVQIEAAWEVLPSMQDIFIDIVQPKTA